MSSGVYAYGNPDAVTLFGVIVEGSELVPIAFFRQRDDAEVFARSGFFHPYKVSHKEAMVVEYTLDNFKLKERTTS